MKKLIISALVLFASTILLNTASAEEKATKEECIKMAKAAAEMLLKEGPEATFAKINDPKGPFVWKDSYVLCMELKTGIMRAHPFKPGLLGRNLKSIKDINGVMFVMDYLNKANTDGEGWTMYMWPKPGEKKPSQKNSYSYRVPGMDYVMVAGVYE